MNKRSGARLGQHFLTGLWAARALARAAEISSGDTVLEIGPGKGALTRELLATAKAAREASGSLEPSRDEGIRGGKIIAIEKDEVLVSLLREKFASEIASGSLTIISADVRDITPDKLGLQSGKYVLAANIPYYITGEIIRQFLTAKHQPRTMALLVQKEVAQRITSDKESILSLSVKAYGTPRLVKKVPKGNFSPAPSVDSAILSITNISRKFFSDLSEENFFKVVRAGFSSKRKFLANNLGVVFGKEKAASALAKCDISEKSRAETVGLDTWACIARQLAASREQ